MRCLAPIRDLARWLRRHPADTLAAVAIVGALALGIVKTTTGANSAPVLGASQAEQLTLRMDAILDTIPEHRFELFDPVLWTYEIAPYFQYEGLTSSPKLPDGVHFSFYPGLRNFHTGGSAACDKGGGGPVFVNARYINPTSSWYAEAWLLPTLVHELIHVQGGGFCSGSSESAESTTQMATLEVLAAMANHGNKDAAYALAFELRSMAMAAVHYEALRDGHEDRYLELRERVYSDPLDRARLEKSWRFWGETAQSRANRREILNKYNYIPLSRALDGLADECVCISNLYLGEWVEPGPYHDVEPPDRYAARSLDIDDLAYFLDHAEAIASALDEPE